jgi:hypothetical protein
MLLDQLIQFNEVSLVVSIFKILTNQFHFPDPVDVSPKGAQGISDAHLQRQRICFQTSTADKSQNAAETPSQEYVLASFFNEKLPMRENFNIHANQAFPRRVLGLEMKAETLYGYFGNGDTHGFSLKKDSEILYFSSCPCQVKRLMPKIPQKRVNEQATVVPNTLFCGTGSKDRSGRGNPLSNEPKA